MYVFLDTDSNVHTVYSLDDSLGVNRKEILLLSAWSLVIVIHMVIHMVIVSIIMNSQLCAIFHGYSVSLLGLKLAMVRMKKFACENDMTEMT